MTLPGRFITRICAIDERRASARTSGALYNRRQFVAGAAALNIAIAASPRTFAASGLSPWTEPFERVVCDARHSASGAFAAAMAGYGVRVSATDGDLTPLWFGDLARHFAAGGAPITGLTTARTALVAIELARGPGVRVLWHAEHCVMTDGSLRHELEGTGGLVARAAESVEGPDWAADLASVLVDAPEDRKSFTRLTVQGAAGDAHPVDSETLSSWVLAPRHSRRL